MLQNDRISNGKTESKKINKFEKEKENKFKKLVIEK